MLALALTLALASWPMVVASSKSPSRSTPSKPEPAPDTAVPADAIVKPSPSDLLPGGVERDVMSFLFASGSTASQDGGVRLEWSGPGGPQLKMSWELLERRNEQISIGDMMVQSLMQLVTQFYQTSGGSDPQAVREKLAAFAGAPLDEARTAYASAVELEGKRLFYIQKAIGAASEAGEALPGVSADLVERRAAAIKGGRVLAAVEKRMGAYRSLAQGLVAYIDSEPLNALEKMKTAGEGLPDVAVVHAYLGSLYYIFQQSELATASWKRSLAIDPTNETVKTALREYGHKGKGK